MRVIIWAIETGNDTVRIQTVIDWMAGDRTVVVDGLPGVQIVSPIAGSSSIADRGGEIVFTEGIFRIGPNGVGATGSAGLRPCSSMVAHACESPEWRSPKR